MLLKVTIWKPCWISAIMYDITVWLIGVRCLLALAEVSALFRAFWLLRPGRGAEYCGQPICLCICVSVCPWAYLWNRWTDRHKLLYADPLWPWLGPPLAALRYVMYFRFYGRRHIWPYWAVWACTGSASQSIAHLAGLWDRSGVWCLWMPCWSSVLLVC